VADTSYARVLTHTFFPTSTMSEASPVPYTPSMSCPMSGVSTPPMESFFSPLSLLPSPPSSMLVPAFMSSALSAGRLCQSPTFMRELGSTNPEWNLAHSYPFQSLAFGAFCQALNAPSILYLLFFLIHFLFYSQNVTPFHAMYVVACETTSRLQALENEKFSLANQVFHLSLVNEQLLSELRTS
ncbi:hypothetical protein ZOSMA_267G00400, partial [Zostera marina]